MCAKTEDPIGSSIFATRMSVEQVEEGLDLARGFHFCGEFLLEDGIEDTVAQRLADLGHNVVRADWPQGGGQAIRLHWDQGTLEAGSEPRKDGCALGY